MALDPETFDALIDTVRRFVAQRLRPLESEVEAADAIPDTIVEEMKALGLFGLSIAEDYGGLGLTVLEDEMHRRAIEGTEEPVFHQGEQCGTVRKYSDTLAIFLAKAHDPEKYRENSKIELAGHLAVSQLSDAELMAELAQTTAILPVTGASDDYGDLA